MGLENGSYRLFRSFLQDQNCEMAFDLAFYSHNGYTLLDESLWEAGDAECIFAHAFEWEATPEGREFWLAIDRKWYRLLNLDCII